ncbi:hypothetical protein [Rheinheimera sp.]|uniref:hypothetical protein n=1 Tax=Rheinheimera sp. TaxID=1869214 RepID=UPI0040482684
MYQKLFIGLAMCVLTASSTAGNLTSREMTEYLNAITRCDRSVDYLKLPPVSMLKMLGGFLGQIYLTDTLREKAPQRYKKAEAKILAIKVLGQQPASDEEWKILRSVWVGTYTCVSERVSENRKLTQYAMDSVRDSEETFQIFRSEYRPLDTYLTTIAEKLAGNEIQRMLDPESLSVFRSDPEFMRAVERLDKARKTSVEALVRSAFDGMDKVIFE